MKHIEVLQNVANADVPKVKKSFEDEGATVSVSDQGDGTSTLVATFPPSDTAQKAQTQGATLV